MRISDWSSRVLFRSKRAAIDNHLGALELTHQFRRIGQEQAAKQRTCHRVQATDHDHGEKTERNRQCEGVGAELTDEMTDRKSVVEGTSGEGRVDLGGRGILKKKKKKENMYR